MKLSFRKSVTIVCIMLLLDAWRSGIAMSYGVGDCTLCHNNKAGLKRSFHSGGEGECKECHIEKGPALKGADASSTCLRCHEAPMGTRNPTGYYVATNSGNLLAGMPPTQLTPGGDFGWLKKNYSWNAPGSVGKSPGERHGHNIVALEYGYLEDSSYRVSPGGNYPSGSLSCTSCHDPHAKSSRGGMGNGSYRMLGGRGYKAGSGSGVVFSADPPIAVSPRVYNRAEDTTDTRVAYGTGMSEWCSNCHVSGCEGRTHPAGSCASCAGEVFYNYNAYRKSGDINGRYESAYSSLVPFEEGTSARELLEAHAQNNGSYLKGADARSNVSCLTCHRAHASGWNHMTRWNMETDFIVYNGRYPGVDNGSPAAYAQGRTAAESRKALYDRPVSQFAAAQRSLCDKCHIKD